MGFRSALVIGAILIFTVLGTFIPMLAQGVMLERISLGALIIALGMLVDNAIVVVEGIQIGMQKGEKPTGAAVAIVKQTMWPLFGATIVAILAFAAIGASNDSTGEYCRSLFLVICYSLFLSWVLALTVTPLFGVKFLKAPKLAEGVDPYGGKIFRMYRGFLEFCIRRRWVTVVVLFITLVASVIGFKNVKQSFFPESTRPQFMVHFWMPQGTHILTTEEKVSQVEAFARAIGGVTDVSTFIGGGAPRFMLTYTPEESNPAYGLLLVGVDDYKKVDALMAELEDYMAAEFPEALTFSRRFMLGPGDPSKIQARFRGPDPAVLRQLSDEAMAILDDEPMAVEANQDWRERVALVRPVIAESQMRNAGITRADIADSLAGASEGQRIGSFREGDELLPIVARAIEPERQDVADLMYSRIWSPVAKGYIPLSQVVLRLETVSEDTIIRRRNRLPTLTVKCDPKSGPASEVFELVRPKIEGINLPPGYTLEWGGEYEDSGKAQAALASKLPIIFIAMVLIVIILYNSLRKPAVIFLTVPLAIIGVTVGLLGTGQPFGFMSLLGFLSLTGMLIKNAIVLVDEIGLQMDSGKEPFVAIVDSGLSRARPVSMAAATTVLGMIPLLADAFFVAMAVTIMVGLTFATVLTLVVVPVLYAIFFKVPNPPKAA